MTQHTRPRHTIRTGPRGGGQLRHHPAIGVSTPTVELGKRSNLGNQVMTDRPHHIGMTISKPQLTGIGEFETRGSVEHCIVDGMHALGVELLQRQ